MHIFANPNESAVKQLLSESGLPIEDITAKHLQHFFGCGSGLELEGLVGLELYGDVALLRSLAVASSRRRTGVGSGLVGHAERHARDQGVKSLYLLTTTAEALFPAPRVCPDSKGGSARSHQGHPGICRHLPRQLGIYGQVF